MDAKEIRKLLDNELLINYTDLLAVCALKVTELYNFYGIPLSQSNDQMKAGIAGTAKQVETSILQNGFLKGLHKGEMDYAISYGKLGELGFAGNPTGRTITGWLMTYVKSPERQEALKDKAEGERKNKWRAEQQANAFLPHPEIDMKAWALESYEAHRKFRKKLVGHKEMDYIPTIREILRVPITSLDFGYCKSDYLRGLGLMNEGETLSKFYDRVYDSDPGNPDALGNLISEREMSISAGNDLPL